MSDLDDLEGGTSFKNSLRWNTEKGDLFAVLTNEFLERVPHSIELGTPAARFAVDMLTRRRGYGLIGDGIYEMILTPVGSPPPPKPADPDYKRAVSFDLWSPQYGLVCMETVSVILLNTIDAFWTRYASFAEAAKGMLPLIEFSGRREIIVRKFTFWVR
jgi:hypothetical protein